MCITSKNGIYFFSLSCTKMSYTNEGKTDRVSRANWFIIYVYILLKKKNKELTPTLYYIYNNTRVCLCVSVYIEKD